MVEAEQKDKLEKIFGKLDKIKDMLTGATSETESEETEESSEEEESNEETEESTETEETSEEESTEESSDDTNNDTENTETHSKDMSLILKRLDVLEQSDLKKDRIIEKQLKTITKLEKTNTKVEHKSLVSKAIDEIKPINKNVVDEDSLNKTMLKTKQFTEDELKDKPDECIQKFIDGVIIAKSEITDGDHPFTGDLHIKKQADAHTKKKEKLAKTLENQGKPTIDEDEK